MAKIVYIGSSLELVKGYKELSKIKHVSSDFVLNTYFYVNKKIKYVISEVKDVKLLESYSKRSKAIIIHPSENNDVNSLLKRFNKENPSSLNILIIDKDEDVNEKIVFRNNLVKAFDYLSEYLLKNQ